MFRFTMHTNVGDIVKRLATIDEVLRLMEICLENEVGCTVEPVAK